MNPGININAGKVNLIIVIKCQRVLIELDRVLELIGYFLRHTTVARTAQIFLAQTPDQLVVVLVVLFAPRLLVELDEGTVDKVHFHGAEVLLRRDDHVAVHGLVRYVHLVEVQNVRVEGVPVDFGVDLIVAALVADYVLLQVRFVLVVDLRRLGQLNGGRLRDLSFFWGANINTN